MATQHLVVAQTLWRHPLDNPLALTYQLVELGIGADIERAKRSKKSCRLPMAESRSH